VKDEKKGKRSSSSFCILYSVFSILAAGYWLQGAALGYSILLFQSVKASVFFFLFLLLPSDLAPRTSDLLPRSRGRTRRFRGWNGPGRVVAEKSSGYRPGKGKCNLFPYNRGRRMKETHYSLLTTHNHNERRIGKKSGRENGP